MQKPVLKLLLVNLLMMAILITAQPCPKGYIRIKIQCISCKSLENVKIDNVDSLTDVNCCPCNEGYSWSKALQRCRPLLVSGRSIKSYIDENYVGQLKEQTPRLLQSCDGSLGFITYRNTCLNCRLLPFTLGVALSSTSCACAPSFSWVSNTCYCGYLSYIDAKTKKCEPCSSLPSTSLLNQCRSCSFAFVQGANGCVYYPTLENNGGEFG
jgi:hypothetical protein